MNKKVSVAIFTKYEDTAKKFIKNVCDNETSIVSYSETEIIFSDVWSEAVSKEKISELAKKNDKLILLVDAIEGVTPKVSGMIEELIKTKKNPIIVINNIENEKANLMTTIEEIEHVLVMRGATDRQLEAPVVYINDTNKISLLDLDEKCDNLNSLYEAIINN